MKETVNLKNASLFLLKIIIAAFIFLAASPVSAGQKAKKKMGKAGNKTIKIDVKSHGDSSHDTGSGHSQDGVVNINSATEAQLCLLPGIGPKKAAAIIKGRKKKPFKKAKDLLRIKGIGRKSLKKLLPFVTVSGETTLKTKVSGM